MPGLPHQRGPLHLNLYGPQHAIAGAPYALHALPYHQGIPNLRGLPYYCTQIVGWSNTGMVPPGWPPNIYYNEVNYCRGAYNIPPVQAVAPPPVLVPPPVPPRYASDDLACRDLARHAAGDAAGRTAGGALMGGLFGAAAGAAIGAAAGDPATGAAIGGAVGATSGAAQGSHEASVDYQRAYQNCMRSRGH